MKIGSRIAVAATSLAFVAVPAVALANGPGDHGNSLRSKAEKQCRLQEKTLRFSRAAFDQLYGTNKNHRNAFGKCVSMHERQDLADQKSAQGAAEKSCRDAESSNAAAFQQKYGTEGNGRHAFGKCVSTSEKAIADRDENEQVKAEDDAAKTCSSEESSSRTKFEQTYHSKNVHDAFGKCVSEHAKAQEQQQTGGSDSVIKS